MERNLSASIPKPFLKISSTPCNAAFTFTSKEHLVEKNFTLKPKLTVNDVTIPLN
jgi:hypothetical protein